MSDQLYRLPGSPSAKTRVFCALVLVLFAVWGALTQIFAARVGYHPRLGPAMLPALPAFPALILAVGEGALALVAATARRFAAALTLLLAALLAAALGRGPLYPPFQLLAWSRQFAEGPAGALAERLQRTGALATLLLAGCFVVVLLVLKSPRPDLHGSARWARPKEVFATGLAERGRRPQPLAEGDGVFLGIWNHRGRDYPLRLLKDNNALVVAPPRAGKGIGVVLPTLLSSGASVIALDIKGELYQKTAGYRSAELGQPALRLDPTASTPQTRFDPLAEVRLGIQEVGDASNIADLLVDPSGALEQRSHWQLTAQTLLTALILHVLYCEPPEHQSLPGCAHVLARPGVEVQDSLRAMLASGHPYVMAVAQSMLDKHVEELSGIVSTANSYLDIYRDPLIAAATATSDFRLADFLEAPLSLYITIPPSALTRTRPFLRLFLSQLIRALTEKMDHSRTDRPTDHRLLLVIDEFPSLGRLHFLQDALGFLAGYGVVALLVAQDLSQIKAAYGDKESLTAQCHYKLFFTPGSPETAASISRLLGDTTVHHHHKSQRANLLHPSSTLSEFEVRRPLLTPDEVSTLPADRTILAPKGHRPILAHRIRYFDDPELLRRSQIPPPARGDRLPQRPRSQKDRTVLVPPPVRAPLSRPGGRTRP